MAMGSALVSHVAHLVPSCLNGEVGWYDSVHDEELGSQPCIFTSVTPVRIFKLPRIP